MSLASRQNLYQNYQYPAFIQKQSRQKGEVGRGWITSISEGKLKLLVAGENVVPVRGHESSFCDTFLIANLTGAFSIRTWLSCVSREGNHLYCQTAGSPGSRVWWASTCESRASAPAPGAPDNPPAFSIRFPTDIFRLQCNFSPSHRRLGLRHFLHCWHATTQQRLPPQIAQLWAGSFIVPVIATAQATLLTLGQLMGTHAGIFRFMFAFVVLSKFVHILHASCAPDEG